MTTNAEIITELHTIWDYVRWATSKFNKAELFYGHGTDNSWDEALELVLFAVNLDTTVHEKALDSNLMQEEKCRIIEIVNKRISERMPAAYITNRAWFAELEFYVDERVLVPRSPIAELIEDGFGEWFYGNHPLTSVLEIGTGSGCIAIAIAAYMPEVTIDAVDNDAAALEVAAKNIIKHQVEHNVKLINSNLFAAVGDKKYDLIISNPPYVDVEDMESLPDEYKHEPVTALAAGEDGLNIVLQILTTAGERLHENGILIVEVGNSAAALVEMFPTVSFIWLDFERGGEGVFLLQRADLLQHQQQFAKALAARSN